MLTILYYWPYNWEISLYINLDARSLTKIFAPS